MNKNKAPEPEIVHFAVATAHCERFRVGTEGESGNVEALFFSARQSIFGSFSIMKECVAELDLCINALYFAFPHLISIDRID